MDEPRGQAQRTAHEASRSMQETTREAARIVNELADRGARASAALTEANQRVLNEFMGLSMEMAQESSRLFLQLQRGMMDVARERSEALTESVSRLQASTQQASSKIEHTRSRRRRRG